MNDEASILALVMARADVSVSALREVHKITGDLLAVIDAIDSDLSVPPVSSPLTEQLLKYLRVRNPELADLTDEEVLKKCGVTLDDRS